MKYTLDTLPVLDAYRENCECPLCRLRISCEDQYVDSMLGAAYMEPECRIKTNETGFCTRHFELMYQRRNRLGLALMTHTHMQEVAKDLKRIHDGDDAVPSKQARYDSLRLGVSWERDVLAKRIDERIHMRLEQGMIEEVQELLDSGVSRDFLLGLGLEYRYITQYLIGEIPDRDDMLAQLAHAIKKFAKRQMTWFRRNPDIIWLDMQGDAYAQACDEIEKFLKQVD